MLDDFTNEVTCEEFYCDDYYYEDEPLTLTTTAALTPTRAATLGTAEAVPFPYAAS